MYFNLKNFIHFLLGYIFTTIFVFCFMQDQNIQETRTGSSLQMWRMPPTNTDHTGDFCYPAVFLNACYTQIQFVFSRQVYSHPQAVPEQTDTHLIDVSEPLADVLKAFGICDIVD